MFCSGAIAFAFCGNPKSLTKFFFSIDFFGGTIVSALGYQTKSLYSLELRLLNL